MGPERSNGGSTTRPSGARAYLDHPKGLYVLFFTEMWERFSFYLMIALLALYMTEHLGFADARASDIQTWYLSLVYFTPFLGGLIADRLTGHARAILAGGVLMMAGHLLLAFDRRDSVQHLCLFGALGLLIAGNGLFKPNISTLVGELYAPKDHRRDQGFTIFYMGINLGAFLAPLAGNFLRVHSAGILRGLTGRPVSDDVGWHVAFGSAGLGMVFSLLIFATHRRRFQALDAARASDEDEDGGEAAGGPAAEAEDDAAAAARGARRIGLGQSFFIVAILVALAWLLGGKLVPWPDALRAVGLWPTTVIHFGAIWLAIELVTVLIFLSGRSRASANAAELKSVFVVVALFWMAFHQNSVTLTFFARDHTASSWDAETFQSVNPLFILLFSPLLVALWGWLDRRGLEPRPTTKMALGMVVTALAYVVMVAAGWAGGDAGKVGPGWLVGTYAFLTVAELLVSPIGLSFTSRLAPARYRALWMGFWFLATSIGNKLVHVTGQFWGKYPPSRLFAVLVVSSLAAAGALLVILALLRRAGGASRDA